MVARDFDQYLFFYEFFNAFTEPLEKKLIGKGLNKPHFKLKLRSMRKFRRKPLFSRLLTPVTMALKTLSKHNFKTSPLGDTECRLLSRAIGSQIAVILMLRKLLLFQ